MKEIDFSEIRIFDFVYINKVSSQVILLIVYLGNYTLFVKVFVFVFKNTISFI